MSLDPVSKVPTRALAHSNTVDCTSKFQFTQGPPKRVRPPLRKSFRIDQSVYPPESSPPSFSPKEVVASRSASLEEKNTSPSILLAADPISPTPPSVMCDQECDISCATNKQRVNNKSSLSDTNQLTACECVPSDKVTYDKHNSFRSTRMRGTSSDRIIAKKRQDHKSVTSLGDRTIDSGSNVSSSGLFEKHLGKFYKLGKVEKAKPSSANALYDGSPTEAFYNKTGSARLSSQELFEKFCSEDFVSLYGHERDNDEYTLYCQKNEECYRYSKSLESSHLTVQVRSSTSDDQSNLEPPLSPKVLKEMSLSLGAIKRHSVKGDNAQMSSKKFDYSSDHSYRLPGPSHSRQRSHFSFDVPFSLPPDITDIVDYEGDESRESAEIKNHSQSAPLLSPNKDISHFNFDIPQSPQNDDNNSFDDSPSDATETRNLTLYEEPHSDRTSLSDIYDPFSSGIRSKRSSIRRELTYKTRPVFDLANLDFRPIDDESPNTSKFVSTSSPDAVNPSTLDTKSYYSDSVFVSPEKVSSKEDSSKITSETIRKVSIREETRSNDSSTLEDEPNSMMDVPEIYVERIDQYSSHWTHNDIIIERTLSPVIEQATEAKSDSVNLTESPGSKSRSLNIPEDFLIKSRPSMHKLEPFYPRKPSNNSDKFTEKIEMSYLDDDKLSDHYDKVRDLPELAEIRKEKSMLFKIKKVKDSNAVAVHRRTRCFPL